MVYLDCTNQNACNWMMFVRSARSFDDQNLAAYQHNGKVYFVTIKVLSSAALNTGAIYVKYIRNEYVNV